jgi:DNA-binding LacI/PurR family transcriptional regulator
MSLYLQLKDQILKKIIDGTYEIGRTLPTEHELGDQYGLSRVTVRKALDDLKKEGLLTGIPRQGTVITSRKGGFSGSLDIIALVAAVQDPFFSKFMEYFEGAAEENGSLMLFKQDFQGVAYQSAELFYRLMQKNIRNVVMWPQTTMIDFDLLMRLRAVGMNFVFFDQDYDTPIADCVLLDNEHAVSSLYAHIRETYSGDILYIGYEGLDLPSAIAREQAFIKVSGGTGKIYNIPWRGNEEKEIYRLLERLRIEGILPAGIICNSGGVGLFVARYLRESGLEGEQSPLATVDYMVDLDEYPLVAYDQPMRQLAEKAYQRLAVQNNQGLSWQAGTYAIQGALRKCGPAK